MLIMGEDVRVAKKQESSSKIPKPRSVVNKQQQQPLLVTKEFCYARMIAGPKRQSAGGGGEGEGALCIEVKSPTPADRLRK
ncbi:hypothetical protein CEXT_509501 [Caerostris extrusa]|uniref:Uncharacterized protein n=1 Tax=Caerostris extrusa TaxID=172846 RepID=A0AAV4YG14_CAEEX|nr:hypothetical protein CEXT_509501 [Caerostris extrusa]